MNQRCLVKGEVEYDETAGVDRHICFLLRESEKQKGKRHEYILRLRQYNTSLEKVLAAMGENGERRINWNVYRTPRELSGKAQALEETREVNMATILTHGKPAISALRKLDQGIAPPRSEIQVPILEELCGHWGNSAEEPTT